jgi:hypothetical protein
VTEDDELPRDPDWDAVPEPLLLLSGLGAPVIVLDDAGVSADTLAVVPGLFGHAKRLTEED